jgi:hypothetical protein
MQALAPAGQHGATSAYPGMNDEFCRYHKGSITVHVITYDTLREYNKWMMIEICCEEAIYTH